MLAILSFPILLSPTYSQNKKHENKFLNMKNLILKNMSSSKNEITLRRVISDLESLKQQHDYDTSALEKVRDALAGVERIDIEVLPMKDVRARVVSLEKVIADAASSITSVLAPPKSSSLTLGRSFKKMIRYLGVNYRLFKDLFKVEGVYAEGYIVTQALLNERWCGDPQCIGIVSLRGMELGHIFARYDFKPSRKSDLSFRFKGSWKVTQFTNSSIPNVKITVAESAKKSFLDVINDFFFSDFSKNFYNGSFFVVMKQSSLLLKHHDISKVPEEVTSGAYKRKVEILKSFGITFGDALTIRDEIVYLDKDMFTIDDIAKKRTELMNSQNLNSQVPPMSIV